MQNSVLPECFSMTFRLQNCQVGGFATTSKAGNVQHFSSTLFYFYFKDQEKLRMTDSKLRYELFSKGNILKADFWTCVRNQRDTDQQLELQAGNKANLHG